MLPPSPNLRVLALDVTNPDSIRAAIDAAGPIDVLVNNAGFAAAPAELMPIDTVRALFETNTIGTIAVTQAVLPQLRQRGAGVVVNVTSSVTLKVLPLLAAYRASKAAVNAYTESVALELAPFGVRAHLVLPGRAPDTRFADNARAHMHGFEHEAYAEFAAAVFARIVDEAAPITTRRTSPKPCGARRPIRRLDAHSGRRRCRRVGGGSGLRLADMGRTG